MSTATASTTGTGDLRSEAELRAIMAASLDPVITIDARGVVQFASASVKQAFGWEPDSLIGQNVTVLMPEPFKSEHQGYLERYMRTGRSHVLWKTMEVSAVRKDGTGFPAELSVARVEVPGEGDPLFTGVLRDITDRKNAEQHWRGLHRAVESVGECIVVTPVGGEEGTGYATPTHTAQQVDLPQN